MTHEIVGISYLKKIAANFNHFHAIFQPLWNIKNVLKATPIKDNRESLAQISWNRQITCREECPRLHKKNSQET